MTPYCTHEVRWFWRGPVPDAVWTWFDALGPPVEAESRTDRYLAPTSDALGVKLREGSVEAKRREGEAGPLAIGAAEARIERWAKWSFALAGDPAPDGGWIAVAKTRRQRTTEAEGAVCALEVATLEVEGETWGSVCLEAHGPDAEAQRPALVGAAETWMGREDAPTLAAGDAMGYPAWLRSL